MRREPSFLKDILLACRKIEAIVATTDEESFPKNEILSAAILHHLTVIGEAVSRFIGGFKRPSPGSAVAADPIGAEPDRPRILRFGLADPVECRGHRYS
jgi:hypothetical protein